MSHSTATAPDPQCPECKGRGWYAGIYYGEATPFVSRLKCACTDRKLRPSRPELIAIAVCGSYLAFLVLSQIFGWGIRK